MNKMNQNFKSFCLKKIIKTSQAIVFGVLLVGASFSYADDEVIDPVHYEGGERLQELLDQIGETLGEGEAGEKSRSEENEQLEKLQAELKKAKTDNVYIKGWVVIQWTDCDKRENLSVVCSYSGYQENQKIPFVLHDGQDVVYLSDNSLFEFMNATVKIAFSESDARFITYGLQAYDSNTGPYFSNGESIVRVSNFGALKNVQTYSPLFNAVSSMNNQKAIHDPSNKIKPVQIKATIGFDSYELPSHWTVEDQEPQE